MFRSALLAMIKSWQREVNPMLDGIYNGEDNHGMNLKIDIVDDEQGEEGQDDNEAGSEKGSSGSKKAAKAGTSYKGAGKSKEKGKEEDKGKGKGKGKRKSPGD